jgi:hypothetical protein
LRLISGSASFNTYLLATVDKLVTTLLREVLVAEEALSTVELLLGIVPVLVGPVFVLLGYTIKKVVTGRPEFTHEPTLLYLSIFRVIWNRISVDGV